MLSPSMYFYTSEHKVIIRNGIMCSVQNPCPGDNMNCFNGGCICNPGYQYQFLYDNITCSRCPGYNDACTGCCALPGLTCINNFCSCIDPNSLFCPKPSIYFATASQIALSAALIMGIAALAMVIYRLCTKPKYETARQRAERRMMGTNSIDNHIRSSLSSMQIRVLARLRDRPPPYQGEPAPSILSVTNIENPPAYNCVRNLETHLPPPYTEIVLNPSGYLNQSFENTEQSACSVNVNNENRNVVKDDTKTNETIDINNNSSNK